MLGSVLRDVNLDSLITPATATLLLPILKKLLEDDLVQVFCGLSLWLHIIRILLILMSGTFPKEAIVGEGVCLLVVA